MKHDHISNQSHNKPRNSTNSSRVPRARQLELVYLTLKGRTTLPTRYKDHVAHPTNQSWIRGHSYQPFPISLNR
jgi:hypothetical protein